MNPLSRSIVVFVVLVGCIAEPDQVNAQPSLLSANPSDATVTMIDVATGNTVVIMDHNDGLTRPGELAIDQFGNLYVANVFSPDILRLSTEGQVTVFVSGGGILTNVHGLTFGLLGDLFIADTTSIYRVETTTGSLTLFGDVTAANEAFNTLEAIVFDHKGNLYAASGQNAQGLGAIVKFDPHGNASVFATGLDNPRDVAVDALGHLYVANRVGAIINRIDLATGSIEVFADLSHVSGDPRGIKTDLNNSVYVLDSNGDIRRWDSDGIGGNVEFRSGSSFSEALALLPGAIPAFEELTSQIESILSLNRGQKHSLISKLNAARRSVARANRNASSGQLSSFVNEVQTLDRRGRLDPATADSLISKAHAIIDSP